MEEQSINEKLKLNVRAKSPIIMSGKSKIAILRCNDKSVPDVDDLNSVQKTNQEAEKLSAKSPTVLPSKTLRHLYSCNNLQSTPNAQNSDKSVNGSRIIMNLSPIMSTSYKTNLKSRKDICQNELLTENLLEQLNNQSSLTIKNTRELDNKFETNKSVKVANSEHNTLDSIILPVHTRKDDNNVKEKAKRCLFEKETATSLSAFDTDQDSLNISLDILEQVCQMSEMMDDSSSEEIKISNYTDKKKKKLAYFLYGNKSPKPSNIDKENELLKLALSMEDNLLTETKSSNKNCFEGKFTSLNQLQNNKKKSSEYDSRHNKNDNLKIHGSGSKSKIFDLMEINDIGNTQMCEIADITEPLESFDDHWTQQYISYDSNICHNKKKNLFHNNSSQIASHKLLKSPVNCKIENKTCPNLKNTQLTLKDDLNETSTSFTTKSNSDFNMHKGFSTAGGKSIKVSDKALAKVQLMLKDDLNETSTSFTTKSISDSDICKGFSTAGGKSIKVSDKALTKVQLMLKDDLNETSTSFTTKSNSDFNMHKGFSTAGGKSIKVSDKALAKVQLMLKDDLNQTSTSFTTKSISDSDICKGFSTAGGKSIKVSDKALAKVQLMLKDDLNETSTSFTTKSNSDFNMHKGFSTAGGKSIQISDKALTKVQLMLKDDLNETSTSFTTKSFSDSNICKGFSTAGGKSVKVSDKALAKVQLMLKDDLNQTSTSFTTKSISDSDICKGFSTAGGKSIKVSDKALAKVQLMLKDDLNETSTSFTTKSNSDFNMHKGFSTAGGKSIQISDKALTKVQLMLKDDLNETSTSFTTKSFSDSNICKGFSTAGGKSVKVSDSALEKIQLMLKDNLNETSNSFTTKSFSNTCKGFSTAGGKSIKVSDKALEKVHTMLKDDLIASSTIIEDKIITNLEISNDFSAFKHNSNKVLDKSLRNIHSTLNDDANLLQLFDNSIETKSVKAHNFNSHDDSKTNASNQTINPISKTKVFDVLKNEEECILEDLSLIDTVEKFEKEQNFDQLVLRKKRPRSPSYENNHKIKKIEHDLEWEKNILKTSFDEYLEKKLNGPKISLTEMVNGALPKNCYVKQFPQYELTKLNFDDAPNIKLYWEKDASDKNKNKIYSFQDIKNLFLSHHFVDEKLISKRWIEHHFHMIYRKLTTTEFSFPNYFKNKLLTAKNVIHQLLYRYYREVEKCQRSALKKILEKDETSTKRIILCVSKVIKTNIAKTYNIELTDGWYYVQGLIDFEMNTLLHTGKVKVGTKLLIYHAELNGAGEGIDPLDVHDGVKLKISTNSTRRVCWFAKLGFYKNPTIPIHINLDSVLPRGGLIGSISLLILRKYPIMYLEKKSNSKSILRNEKMEAIEAEKYKTFQQKSLDTISNKIETELIAEMSSKNKNPKQFFSSIKKEHLDQLSIDELNAVIENSTDPLEIQSLLSEDTLEALKNFKKSEQDRFYNELQNRIDRIFQEQFKNSRKVTPLFKLRVVDEKYASTRFKSAMLTIWNPSEDVFSILNKSTEGQCCTIQHLTSSGIINGELQLSANKNTRFNFQGINNEFAKRDIVSFNHILSDTFSPLFGELDFVGVVITHVNKDNDVNNEVYVSDKEMNIVCILFRSNIKEYGCDDMMCPGSIVSGVNIQFRGFNKISPVPKLYSTEQSIFTSNPKTENHLNMFNDYKLFLEKTENQDFLKCCQIKLSEVLKKHIEITTTNNGGLKQQFLNTSKSDGHRSYGELPVTVVKTCNTSHSEFSPAQKRIKMLNKYGKTPPLNIVHTKPPDKKLMNQFKTPTRL